MPSEPSQARARREKAWVWAGFSSPSVSAMARSVSPRISSALARWAVMRSVVWAYTASPDWGRGLMMAASSDSVRVWRSSETGSGASPISPAIWSSAPMMRFHTWPSSPACSRRPASISAFRRSRSRSAASMSSMKP